MSKRHAILFAAIFLAGCHSEPNPKSASGVPDGAKIEEVKDTPITADTWFASGQLAEATSDQDKAIIQYNQALQINPKHSPSLYRLGVIYAERKEFPTAVEMWKKYITATNDSAAGYGNLGFCYELMMKRDLAEAAYKKGIEIEPTNQLCRVNYGLLLARNGQINEALTQFATVLPPAAAHYNLGSVYETQKKWAQAKLEYTRALECDPTFFDAQQRLASLAD